jgi:SAM-dependent methyltransferase
VAHDSSNPAFWDQRYRGGVTPWDARGVPPRLRDWIRGKPPARILIPGCGTGYEVRLLTQLGHDVLAIDFADAALDAARLELGPLAHLVAKADFFVYEAAPFDVVYERALLCALPRRMGPQWAASVARLLRPGGELAGFFYLDDNERGPPFGIARNALTELLEPAFELAEDLAVPAGESIPVFQGKERWQVWKRRP